jgi:hypothetical protein
VLKVPFFCKGVLNIQLCILVLTIVGAKLFKAIFHCSRFARAGGATNFNHLKNQSRGHAKQVECSSTFKACPASSQADKKCTGQKTTEKVE